MTNTADFTNFAEFADLARLASQLDGTPMQRAVKLADLKSARLNERYAQAGHVVSKNDYSPGSWWSRNGDQVVKPDTFVSGEAWGNGQVMRHTLLFRYRDIPVKPASVIRAVLEDYLESQVKRLRPDTAAFIDTSKTYPSLVVWDADLVALTKDLDVPSPMDVAPVERPTSDNSQEEPIQEEPVISWEGSLLDIARARVRWDKWAISPDPTHDGHYHKMSGARAAFNEFCNYRLLQRLLEEGK